MLLLQELAALPGVAGSESPVAELIADCIRQRGGDVRTDSTGNVMGLFEGSHRCRRRVMISAHMDQVGLMITDVIEGGFLKFTAIGSIDPRILPGVEVNVHGTRTASGIIGTRPPHLVPEEERRKPIPMEDLFIDTGMGEKESKDIFRPGCVASFRMPPKPLVEGSFSSPGLDNRVGVAVALMAAGLAGQYGHADDIVVVATAQEELGMRGATVAAYSLKPNLGLAVDVTFASMGSEPEPKTVPMGKGPAIGIGPHLNPKLASQLKECAQRHSIQHQMEPLPSATGTDASALQISRSGIPTGLVSIPIRYMHSPVETVRWKDIEDSAELVGRFLSGLDEDFWRDLDHAAV